MTYTKFIKEVSLLPKKFTFTVKDGRIVTNNLKAYCPWAAWWHHYHPVSDIITDHGRDINSRIWNAADNMPRHVAKIRQDLLKACKLG